MSPNELDFGQNDPIVDDQLDFGQNDPIVGKPKDIAVNELDFGKDDPIVTDSNYFAELGKYAGKSMTEAPGSMVKAFGGALDVLERGTRNNPLLMVDTGEFGLSPSMMESLKRPEVTGSTVGNIVQDVGQEMVERPKLFGVDVGYTKELGLLPDPLRANQTTMQAAGSIGSLAATFLTPGGVIAKTLMGGALQSQGQADQAKRYILEKGGTEEQANEEAATQFVLNMPAGALEALPWGNFLNKFGGTNLLKAAAKKYGTSVTKRIAKAIGEQAFLEGGEEGLQQLIGNLTALNYNPDQKINEGIIESIKVGALMGAGMVAPPQIAVEVANKLSKDYEAKTDRQQLANVKQAIAETKKNDPENDTLLNSLTDLADRLENKVNDRSSVAEFNATVQKADKERADAIAAEKSAANIKAVGAELAGFRPGENGMPDPTDRPERQLEIMNLAGSDVSTLPIERQIAIKGYTASLKDEIARKKAMSTAASDQEKAQQAQIAESQKAATATDKAINKLVATANPTPTAVDMGVTATDAIKSNPATATAALNNLTNTTLGTPAAAPAAAGAEAPVAAPVREGGVFADIINPPVNDQELAGIAEEIKGKSPEEAIKLLQTKLTELDKRLTPEQKAMGVSMIDQLKKTPAPVKTTELEIKTNDPSEALSQWQKYVSSVEKESNELISEWASLIRQRGPYKEFINQGWADKLGITLKSLNEYWAIFSQAGPGTLKYKDTISQFATDRINQKKKPAIVTHAEVLERISQLRRMTKSSAGGDPQMLDSMARQLASLEAKAAKYEADNSPSKAVPVAPEKAPLSEQEFGMIANELQGKTPEQSRDIIKNVMATVGDRLTPDQKAYAKKALKGLNDTIAQAQAAQKLPEPVVPVAPSPDIKKSAFDRLKDFGKKLGLTYVEPNVLEPNPLSVVIKDSSYPTFISEDGKVKIAFEANDLYTREGRPGVYLGDPSNVNPNLILISAIITDEKSRGKGLGSKALNEFLSVADEAGVTLKLEPVRMNDFAKKTDKASLSNKGLIEWYKRHGFKEIAKGDNRILVREPRPKAAVPVAAPVSTQEVLPQPTGVNVSPIETVAPTVAPTAELGEQEVAIERFDTKGNYVEDTLTAVNAKKWADEKLDTLTKLLDCLKR